MRQLSLALYQNKFPDFNFYILVFLMTPVILLGVPKTVLVIPQTNAKVRVEITLDLAQRVLECAVHVSLNFRALTINAKIRRENSY